MPNHITTLIIFENITQEQSNQIKSYILNENNKIDFQILLPMPLNVFKGDFGRDEESRFGGASMCNNWCTNNWSTKWNAYGEMIIEYKNNNLFIQFETAWSIPALWMLALFNKCNIPFIYHYLDEGDDQAKSGYFKTPNSDDFVYKIWNESPANDEDNHMMHVRKYGDDYKNDLEE